MRRVLRVVYNSLLCGKTGGMADWALSCSCVPGKPHCCPKLCWVQTSLPVYRAALIRTRLSTTTTKIGLFIPKSSCATSSTARLLVQSNTPPARRSVLIIDGVNTHLRNETIQHVWCVFTMFYIQGKYIPTPNANGPFYCFVMFCKIHTNTRPLPNTPSRSVVPRYWLGRPT